MAPGIELKCNDDVGGFAEGPACDIEMIVTNAEYRVEFTKRGGVWGWELVGSRRPDEPIESGLICDREAVSAARAHQLAVYWAREYRGDVFSSEEVESVHAQATAMVSEVAA